ncbi:MAG: ATP phosphoribosyltransferase regulatory subunit, partial [Candidatus Komeilibacteria bacterium]|nr:ATP phosphoribosyltransferase regulatory subunit [Candidatus Komeilibacteria bacterium]
MKIKPDAPGGVRDYSPSEMIFRLKVLDTIQQVFSRFGFDPLETPVLERTLVLTGGKPEDVGSAIYRAEIYEKGKSQEIGLDPDRQTSLRFDLTVPLARYVAANMTKLQFPFKRQQRGLVFRGEKPQAGRYREFIQFDADTVGTSSMMADAEIIELMASTLEALRISRFVVKFNNRKILNGLSQVAGFEPDKV